FFEYDKTINSDFYILSYTTLFRSPAVRHEVPAVRRGQDAVRLDVEAVRAERRLGVGVEGIRIEDVPARGVQPIQVVAPFVCRGRDRKSTRLNSSHVKISYAVFCLK